MHLVDYNFRTYLTLADFVGKTGNWHELEKKDFLNLTLLERIWVTIMRI